MPPAAMPSRSPWSAAAAAAPAPPSTPSEHQGQREAGGDGRRLQGFARAEPEGDPEAVQGPRRRAGGAAVHRSGRLPEGDRLRRGPGVALHAAGLPPDAVRGGGEGRQARVHGEARGDRRPRRPPRPGRQRGGEEEETGRGRRPSPPPRSEIPRNRPPHPRRPARRVEVPAGVFQQRAASGSVPASRTRPKCSTRCGTGTTSPG